MSRADISSDKFNVADGVSGDGSAGSIIVACFFSIAWYNALELIILCFITFKRYRGCYFWSLLIATFCIIPFNIGYLLIIYDIYQNLFPVAMELVAWVGMVTGQSLVLWSRLHLLCNNPYIVRGTLAMIIIDAIIFHIPGSVLELGSHSNKSHLFATGFNIFERIQLIGFSIQEIILSIIYSWEAVRLLNLRARDDYRGTLVQLLVVNLLMILMDAAVIAVQFAGLFDLHVSLKAVVYSVKLKLEYAILGKLVAVTNTAGSNSAPTLPDFVDLSFHNIGMPQSGSGSQARLPGDNPLYNAHDHIGVSSKDSPTHPRRSLSSTTYPNSSTADS